MQIAIDTATAMAKLAIVKDSQVLAETTWHCQQSHTTELLPRLAQLLGEAKVNIQSARGIIVAKGPGSFNGIRVGISTAKGLAFSLGIPIVGISNLEVAAYQYAETGLPICPVFNAGRGEIATAVYQKKDKEWRQLVAEHITTLDVLCAQITIKTVFCGEFIPDIARQLIEKLKENAVIPPDAAATPPVRLLAELGLKRLESGNYDNVVTLQPLYLRHPAITEPKKQIRLETKNGNLASNIN